MSDYKRVEWRQRNYTVAGRKLLMSRGEKKETERIVYPFPLEILTISRVFEAQGHGFMVVSMGLTPHQVLQGQVQSELLHLHPSVNSVDDPAASIVDGADTRFDGPCLEVAYERRVVRVHLDKPRYEPAPGYLDILDYLIAQHLKGFNADQETIVPVGRQLRAPTLVLA